MSQAAEIQDLAYKNYSQEEIVNDILNNFYLEFYEEDMKEALEVIQKISGTQLKIGCKSTINATGITILKMTDENANNINFLGKELSIQKVVSKNLVYLEVLNLDFEEDEQDEE